MFDFVSIIADLEAKRTAIDAAIVAFHNLQTAWNPPCATAETKIKPHRETRRVAARRPKSSKDHKRHKRLSPLQDALLNVLVKCPMTSIEAHEALAKAGTNTTAGSVYQTLRFLLEKGSIERVQNDEGKNAWRLK